MNLKCLKQQTCVVNVSIVTISVVVVEIYLLDFPVAGVIPSCHYIRGGLSPGCAQSVLE